MPKNDISDQLAYLFNPSLTTGSFPTLLKTAKVIFIHKKELKLDDTNHRSISLLSNLDKILEKLMQNSSISFEMITGLFILSSLALDKNTLPPLR